MPLDVYKDWLGIPEGPRPPDHYELLRLVRFEDDPDKVQKHYRKLNAHVRKYATGEFSKESQELLNELARAMLCLTDPVRKREYDESLGREFEEEAGVRRPMEDILVAEGAISAGQRDEARRFAESRGLSLRDAVVQMKLADAETATRAMAAELGFSYVNLGELVPDDSVLDKLPRNTVKRNQALPLFVDDDVLLVACVHEPDPHLEEEIRLRYGVPMRPVLATPLAVNQAISKYYAAGMRDEAAAEAAAAVGKKGKAAAKKGSKKSVPVVKTSAAASPQQSQERRLVGILIMLWSLLGSALLDAFVLPNFISMPIPYLLTIIIPPIAVLYVLKVYWKK
ncbi:MAG: general secretion pathway protein GspE [Planctomycetes bacterium]|nr:general secretion pathway protein GspE [Planctomycetota bacterium]